MIPNIGLERGLELHVTVQIRLKVNHKMLFNDIRGYKKWYTSTFSEKSFCMLLSLIQCTPFVNHSTRKYIEP